MEKSVAIYTLLQVSENVLDTAEGCWQNSPERCVETCVKKGKNINGKVLELRAMQHGASAIPKPENQAKIFADHDAVEAVLANSIANSTSQQKQRR